MSATLDILSVLNVLRAAKKGNIYLSGGIADPVLQISCTGQIVIKSIKSGAHVTAVYNSLVSTSVTVQADAGTLITISGRVTELNTGVDISTCTIAGNKSLQTLRLRFTMEHCHITNCSALTDLYWGNTYDLTDVSVSNCPQITNIFINNSCNEVAQVVIGIIQDNAANHGTVSMMNTDAYYTDVQNAAIANGWTVI